MSSLSLYIAPLLFGPNQRTVMKVDNANRNNVENDVHTNPKVAWSGTETKDHAYIVIVMPLTGH